ncbi:sensitivity to high expression protein she9 [Coemansia sp. RSA 1933]|nr:sensitivity to high expression protein she9 [Coemansia sp. RSA 1933]
MALVPLNVIYLPPPHWHTPLRPLNGVVPPPAEKPQHAPASGDANTARIPDTETAGPSMGRQSSNESGDKAQPSFALGHVFRSMFSARSRTSGQATKEKDSASLSEDVTRWQRESALFRTLVSAKGKLDSLRSLPKDDDWITWVAKALNQMTGYDRISDLKTQVEDSGTLFHQARRSLESAKQSHTSAIKDRIASQREINSLLQRKHLWNEDDVARFTTLYRTEHQSETAELAAATLVKDAESLVDRRYDALVNSIRMRYHEEQIWSDKIRRASTYGTWAVLFMNIAALFMAQAIFEPRKRRKIITGVDEKLTVALDAHKQERTAQIDRSLEQRMDRHEQATRSIVDHLSTMSAVLGAVAARQEAEASAALNHRSAVDPVAMALGGDSGYSDAELDMYYEQQQQRSKDRVYTKTQAQQMAAAVAAAASLVVGLATYYFAT